MNFYTISGLGVLGSTSRFVTQFLITQVSHLEDQTNDVVAWHTIISITCLMRNSKWEVNIIPQMRARDV